MFPEKLDFKYGKRHPSGAGEVGESARAASPEAINSRQVRSNPVPAIPSLSEVKTKSLSLKVDLISRSSPKKGVP